MDERFLSKITNVHNDVHIGTKRSANSHDGVTYFVEVVEPKVKEIERFFINKTEYNKVFDICQNMLTVKAKFKTKEKRMRQKIALKKIQDKLKAPIRVVELDGDLE